MEPQKPASGNSPGETSDLSYQVMPQEGNFDPVVQPSPPPQRPATPPAPPNRPSSPPMPPPSTPHESSPSLLPQEPEPSFFRSRWVYILGGLLVLIVLGVLAYLMLGKKSAPPAEETVTRLPKVWLLQYYSQKLNTDGSCNDLIVCGDDADRDTDGLKNYDEFKAGTNPTVPDTDADGLADGDEVNIYKTEPTLIFTDRRELVAANNWLDGFQVRNGYDPLTPGIKFTDVRKQQIADDTAKFSLHEPTLTTVSNLNTTNPIIESTGQVQNVAVAIQNNLFNPGTITIKKGDIVIWSNNDSVAHTVTGDNGGPNSQNIPLKGTYSYTFNEAGTFTYHCSIHPTMTGSVVVQ